MRPVRLRLILVPAAEVRGATDWLGALEQLRGTDQHYPWMPRQNTDSMLLWAYAADGDSRPMLWLGPKTKNEPNTMVLRHWLTTKLVPTFPLPGIYFFDAWRIRPKLDIPLHISVGLTAVDLTHDEEMPQEPEAPDTTHVDRLLQRHAVLTARADAKTAADCTMEVSHVVQLTEALLEAEGAIEESTAARHRYLNVQKEHEDNLEQQGGHGDELLVRRGDVRLPLQRHFPYIYCPTRGRLNCHVKSLTKVWVTCSTYLMPGPWYVLIWCYTNRPATMPSGEGFCISMSICGPSHQRLLMQPLMSMHEGLLSIGAVSGRVGPHGLGTRQGNYKGSSPWLSLPSW